MVYLAIFLIERGLATGLVKKNTLAISITQGQISDTLGLSLVHTNRTLQTLRKKGLVIWSLTEISIPDLDAAREFAHYEGDGTNGSDTRPYI